jgi:hypothetical protein
MTPAVAEKIPAGGGISLARKLAGPAPEIPPSPYASVSPKTSEAGTSDSRFSSTTCNVSEIVRGLTPETKVVPFPSDKIDGGVRVRSRGGAD